MKQIEINLQIQQDLNSVMNTTWWRRFQRALEPGGGATQYWYAFYGGTDGTGDAIVIDREVTEIIVTLDGDTADAYHILNVVYPRWRSLPSDNNTWQRYNGPKSGLTVDWADTSPNNKQRSVVITDTPGVTGDMVNIEFGLLVQFGSNAPFICDPSIKNRW